VPHSLDTISDSFTNTRSHYLAAKRSSRLRRRRQGIPPLGSSADWHYQSEGDYLWMAEAARDMDRNDLVIGQAIDRVVENTVQGGFSPEPQTGDEGLDQALKARWVDESTDPLLCDAAGQFTFREQTKLVLRDCIVAGDIFAIPTADGPVQLVEGHRCRSPYRTKKNIVHGVEMTETRKRIRYWFTQEPINPHAATGLRLKDLQPIQAYDANGRANVWHVYFPKRVTQTRGVTALAPCFDAASMHDDIQFAELLHRQVASCFFIFRNRTSEWDPTLNAQAARIGNELPADGTQRRIEGVVPGLELTGAKGEMLTMDSPNIPNQTYFPHVRMVLTFISINLGLPLVVFLLDASETNFSGYRGAIDQARIGFRSLQAKLIEKWCRPNWWWKVERWAEDDPAMAAALESGTLWKHTWSSPNFAYIEPTKDATADLIRQSNLLISPSRWAAERGYDWQELVSETVRDRRLAIEQALQIAGDLNQTHGLTGEAAVRWRDLAPLPNADGVTIAITDGPNAPNEKDPA